MVEFNITHFIWDVLFGKREAQPTGFDGLV